MRDKLVGLTLRTTLVYAVFATLCFVLSGKVAALFLSDARMVLKLEIFKGLAFVAVTAFLLYITLRRQMKWLSREVNSQAQAEQLMRESQARFVTIFRLSPIGISLSKLDDGRLVDVNPAVLKILGCNREELVGRTLREAKVFPSPEGRDRLVEAVRAHTAVEGVELQFRRKSGEIRTMLVSAELIRLRGKDHLLDMMLDITDRKRAEEAKEKQYRDVFEASAIGMALVALDGRWLKVNQSLCSTFGYSETELLSSKTIRDMTHPDDLACDHEYLKRLIERRIPCYRVEKRFCHRDGYTIWGLLGVSMVRDDQGRPLHFVCHVEDITERKFLEEKLQAALITDELTGLLNRKGFFQLSQDRLNSPGSQILTLIFLRLNGMKLFNDRFGRKKGDALIASTARMLRQNFRERDIIGRIGGAEFAALVAGETQGVFAQLERDAVNLAAAARTCLSARIGVACAGPGEKPSVEQLIVSAHEAMAEGRTSERRPALILRKRRHRLPIRERHRRKDRIRNHGFHRGPALSRSRFSLAAKHTETRRLRVGKA